jgi:hypothetical protein
LKENTQYNFDAGKNLLSEEDKTVFGVTDADFKSNSLPIGQYRISTVLFREGVLDRCLNSIELIYKSLKVVLKDCAG